jgi:NAD(P)-dependent dehydrogenase (short-subunit alcohol dehydrogenase family)
MKNLFNKVIIVTGGNGLIGESIVDDLISEGAIVINADVGLVDDYNNNQFFCDVTKEISVATLLKTVVKKYDKIDGLVNNAYPKTADWGNKFEDIKYESWKKNIDIQLNSVFITTKAIVDIMKIQGFGSIINVASIYGCIAPDFSIYEGTNMTMPAAYSAIKGGVISYSKYLASYCGKYGIRVNCVSPGGIFNNQPDEFIGKYIKKVPLNRMGYPKDIAPAISFLLSDKANYITGHNLIIDGGLTII